MVATVEAVRAERRGVGRVDSDCMLKVSELSYGEKSGDSMISKAINISSNGVLVESDREFSESALLKLEISLPRWEKYKSEFMKYDHMSISRPLVVIGKVARSWKEDESKYLIGVEFLNMDEGHKRAMSQCISDMI